STGARLREEASRALERCPDRTAARVQYAAIERSSRNRMCQSVMRTGRNDEDGPHPPFATDRVAWQAMDVSELRQAPGLVRHVSANFRRLNLRPYSFARNTPDHMLGTPTNAGGRHGNSGYPG